MTRKFARNAAAGIILIAAPIQLQAQSSRAFLGRAYHYCTFTQACNWSSHAIIAFSATYMLNKAGLPRGASAGAAALFFVGKEVRDHLKWGVLGSADSNGDLATGVIGAAIAYQLLRPTIRVPEATFALDVRERAWLTIKLAAP
jgi:hypothetical protein